MVISRYGNLTLVWYFTIAKTASHSVERTPNHRLRPAWSGVLLGPPSFCRPARLAEGPDRKPSTRRQEKAQTESIEEQTILDGQRHFDPKHAADA
jgi:hypothetical protein